MAGSLVRAWRNEADFGGIVLWVLLFFAPTLMVFWPAQLRLVVPEIDLQAVTQWLPFYQIILGVLFAESLALRLGYRPLDRAFPLLRVRTSAASFWLAEGPLRGWIAVIGLLLGVQAVQWAVTSPLPLVWSISTGELWALIASLGFYILLVALPEELWFRGLWFETVGRRFVPGVIGGATLFALLHAHLGPSKVIMTFGIGVAYGTARWVGAPLVALVLAHGMMNWLNNKVWPAQEMVIDPQVFPFAVLGGFLALATGLAMFGKYSRENPINAD